MKIAKTLTIGLLLASTFAHAVQAAPPAKGTSKPAAKKPATAPSKAPAGKPAANQGNQGNQGKGSSAAFNSYADQMRQKMGTSWQYPNGKNRVTLTIQVTQDGSVSNLTLDSSPKNTEAEQKANDAFNAAQPLQALPSGVQEATITAIFDSQADQWDSKANISVKIDPSKSAPPGDNKSAESGDSANKDDKK